MPVPHRPPMPKLPPFALADTEPKPSRPYYLIAFFVLFALPLFMIHASILGLPYFWDEHGQFIPTALDLLRHGEWIARSTLPNVHPPGVEAYLVLWYKVFGYSIPITRVAMLMVASFGLLLTFLLAIELSREASGAPAFWPPFLLLVSPLFYTQSFMAQLDMPAMVFTLLALLLFLKGRFLEAAAASVALVLVKETGIVTPLIFFLASLLFRRDWKRAAYFIMPAIALGGWLVFLHRGTGYWLGNPEFAHYNVAYSLHPVRIALSLVRRFYYLFIAEFRWIGSLAVLLAVRSCEAFRTSAWRVTIAVALANVALVSVLGGAELERYLLPVLPIFYIAVVVALTTARKAIAITATVCLIAGLIASIFWNPPYPFPYENNYAMIDFVRLQQTAAGFVERNFPGQTIATAWPYTASLRDPDYGYVRHPLKTVETRDFHYASVRDISPNTFAVLIVYTRTWAPDTGVIAIPAVQRFLSRFYQWQPDITVEQCAELGLYPRMTWRLRGQEITIYTRDRNGFTASQPL